MCVDCCFLACLSRPLCLGVGWGVGDSSVCAVPIDAGCALPIHIFRRVFLACIREPTRRLDRFGRLTALAAGLTWGIHHIYLSLFGDTYLGVSFSWGGGGALDVHERVAFLRRAASASVRFARGSPVCLNVRWACVRVRRVPEAAHVAGVGASHDCDQDHVVRW